MPRWPPSSTHALLYWQTSSWSPLPVSFLPTSRAQITDNIYLIWRERERERFEATEKTERKPRRDFVLFSFFHSLTHSLTYVCALPRPMHARITSRASKEREEKKPISREICPEFSGNYIKSISEAKRGTMSTAYTASVAPSLGAWMNRQYFVIFAVRRMATPSSSQLPKSVPGAKRSISTDVLIFFRIHV